MTDDLTPTVNQGSPYGTPQEEPTEKAVNPKRRFQIAIIAVALAVVAGSAFAYTVGSVIAPSVEVYNAYSNLAKESSLNTNVSFNVSAQGLAKVFNLSDSQVADAKIRNVKNLNDLSVVINKISLNVQNQKTSNNLPKVKAGIQYGGLDLFGFGLIDRTLYLDTDAFKIATTDSTAPFTAEQVNGLPDLYTNYMQSLGAQPSADDATIIDDLRNMVAGTPLSYTFTEGTSAGDAFDKVFKTSSKALNSTLTAEQKALEHSFGNAMLQSSTLVKNGSDTNGDRIDVTINMSNVYKLMQVDFDSYAKDPAKYPDLSKLKTDLDGLSSLGEGQAKKLKVSLWIKGKQFSQIRIYLASLSSQASVSTLSDSDLYLQMTFNHNTQVIAPQSARSLNTLIDKLMGNPIVSL